MIVVDASVVADFLVVRDETGAWAAEQVASADSLHAPHLLDVEVTSVVRRWALAGEISSRRGRLALGDLADLRVTRYPTSPFVDRIWRLRENLTAYDAAYVALAEALGAPLLTTDRRLAAAGAHGARVVTFPG
ncbi:MAG: type II toxin-antitoxin system VapC family toxin [Actinomycetota bacterium]|nr:type II toxin-antitoxin system VapC family toxin [Actinomycetota bacterium]